jgi:hypothetical protein
MSTRLIQDLHAGISRRDWSAVETAANAIRDESEKVRRCLAATDFGSLPADYATLRMVEDRMEQLSRCYLSPQTNGEAFEGSLETDTPLQAAAREAGWALTTLVDISDWQRRDQISAIIGRLAAALLDGDIPSPETRAVGAISETTPVSETDGAAISERVEMPSPVDKLWTDTDD